MKRTHLAAHRFIWLSMGPVLFGLLLLAVSHTPPPALSDSVPDSIVTEPQRIDGGYSP
ncbi:MAG: hypothetical protein AAGJ32_09145 [Pseudomonadota bacterium]